MLRRLGDFLNVIFIVEIIGCVRGEGDKKGDDGEKLETQVHWNDAHTPILTFMRNTLVFFILALNKLFGDSKQKTYGTYE